MGTLKNVAIKTDYSYVYVKMVHCGLKDNVKILKEICNEKRKEIKDINNRIKEIEDMAHLVKLKKELNKNKLKVSSKNL